ncbi:hypothetical protein ACWEPC_05155 [Nonomuraea sp. NPDC004297]
MSAHFTAGEPVYVLDDPISYGVIESVRDELYFCHMWDEAGEWWDWYPASCLKGRGAR